ncbi:hypothetical protein [Streptomyces sp. NPDC056949]|uniref:hypothetical protein n=1 Tax=Streptomyces sp. NPDC056949 TaxID=3345976 RepID=UPI00362EA27F
MTLRIARVRTPTKTRSIRPWLREVQIGEPRPTCEVTISRDGGEEAAAVAICRQACKPLDEPMMGCKGDEA